MQDLQCRWKVVLPLAQVLREGNVVLRCQEPCKPTLAKPNAAAQQYVFGLEVGVNQTVPVDVGQTSTNTPQDMPHSCRPERKLLHEMPKVHLEPRKRQADSSLSDADSVSVSARKDADVLKLNEVGMLWQRRIALHFGRGIVVSEQFYRQLLVWVREPLSSIDCPVRAFAQKFIPTHFERDGRPLDSRVYAGKMLLKLQRQQAGRKQ